MKIAVLSDTHDHIWNLNKALQLIKEYKCGIICSILGGQPAPASFGIYN